MTFLIIDTSTNYCSVALSVNFKIYNDTKKTVRQHNKYLLKMVKKLFIKAKVDIKSLDFVSYGVGPGSFVGVRLAAAVCHAFAVSLNIPIIGFSSMFVLAKSSKINSRKIAVILDAKINNFYLGLYDIYQDNIILENIYKISEYSQNLYFGYHLIGESIKELNIKNNDFLIDVSNVEKYIFNIYKKQKDNNSLTQEIFPIYFIKDYN